MEERRGLSVSIDKFGDLFSKFEASLTSSTRSTLLQFYQNPVFRHELEAMNIELKDHAELRLWMVGDYARTTKQIIPAIPLDDLFQKYAFATNRELICRYYYDILFASDDYKEVLNEAVESVRQKRFDELYGNAQHRTLFLRGLDVFLKHGTMSGMLDTDKDVAPIAAVPLCRSMALKVIDAAKLQKRGATFLNIIDGSTGSRIWKQLSKSDRDSLALVCRAARKTALRRRKFWVYVVGGAEIRRLLGLQDAPDVADDETEEEQLFSLPSDATCSTFLMTFFHDILRGNMRERIMHRIAALVRRHDRPGPPDEDFVRLEIPRFVQVFLSSGEQVKLSTTLIELPDNVLYLRMAPDAAVPNLNPNQNNNNNDIDDVDVPLNQALQNLPVGNDNFEAAPPVVPVAPRAPAAAVENAVAAPAFAMPVDLYDDEIPPEVLEWSLTDVAICEMCILGACEEHV